MKVTSIRNGFSIINLHYYKKFVKEYNKIV